MISSKIWKVKDIRADEERVLIDELNIHPVIARLLCNRNIVTPELGRAFLYDGTEALLDPFSLKGMNESVDRIVRAINHKERIVVYGDYDVDGITATSLMYRFLKKIGASVDYYIPERQSEGYGLNEDALEHIISKGVQLVITVDCGISSWEIVERVKERIDIIITDHHNPSEQIPEAIGVINPKQQDCPYADKNLSGVGVAFKLCQALYQSLRGENFVGDLDIVALGTVADIVPLVGENRIIVKEGLKKINERPLLGIQALKEVALGQRMDPTITTGDIGFKLAPRLNAAGRVTHATEGVELLVSEEIEEAKQIAQHLDETNKERQTIEKGILEEARQNVLLQGELSRAIMVVAGTNWHSGVIGIVASRLVEEFYKPAVMISVTDGIGKGSCRSIEAFDVYEALHAAKDLLIQFGGHKQAAGLTIEADKIPDLRRMLTAYCDTHLKEEDYIPVVKIDALLQPEDITIDLIDEIRLLEPYGMGNSTPVFALEDIKVVDVYHARHSRQPFKLLLRLGYDTVDALIWGGKDYKKEIFAGDTVRLAFTMKKHEWRDIVTPQLTIQDIEVQHGVKPRLTKEGLREMYVLVKRLFTKSLVPQYDVDNDIINSCPQGQTPREAMLALEVFKELGIIVEEPDDKGDMYRWSQIEGKLDLVTSVTFLKYST